MTGCVRATSGARPILSSRNQRCLPHAMQAARVCITDIRKQIRPQMLGDLAAVGKPEAQPVRSDMPIANNAVRFISTSRASAVQASTRSAIAGTL